MTYTNRITRQSGHSNHRDQLHENPLTGNKIRFLHVPQDSDEGVLTFEVTFAPGNNRVPFELRKRPNQVQYLLVTEGVLCGNTSDQSDQPHKYESFREVDESDQSDSTSLLRIEAGQEIRIDNGVNHQFRNCQSTAETQVLVQLTPPRDMFQWITNGYEEAYRRVGEPNPAPFIPTRVSETHRSPEEVPAHESRPRRSVSESTPEPSAHARRHEPTVEQTEFSSTTAEESEPQFPSLVASFRRFLRPAVLSAAVIGGLYSIFSLGIYLLFIDYIGVDHGQHRLAGHILFYSLGFTLFIPVLGYFARIGRNALYSYDTVPTFRDLPALLADGTKVAVIGTIFFFYPAAALIVILGPAALVVRVAIGEVTGIDPTVGTVFTTLMSLIALYVFPAVYMKVIETGQLRSAIRFSSLGPAVLRKPYFVGHLRSAVVLLGILSLSVLFILVAPVLGAIIGSIVLFYGFITLSDYFARVWLVAIPCGQASSQSITNRLIEAGVQKVRTLISRSTPAEPSQGTDGTYQQDKPAGSSGAVPQTTLGRLHQLHETGALTTDEYEQKKRVVSRESTFDTSQTAEARGSPSSATDLIEDLYQRDLLTEQEYETKLQEHDHIHHESVDPETASQVRLLRELHELGVFSDEEFQRKLETVRDQ